MKGIHAVRRLFLAALLAPLGAYGAGDAVVRVDRESITAAELVAPETEHNRQRMTPEEFDEWQAYSRNKRLLMAVREPLMKAYSERAGLVPTEAEIDAYARQHMSVPLPKSAPKRLVEQRANPSEAERRLLREWAERAIREIKVGEALWREHGGSCGFGSLGSCTPFEGQTAFFKEEVEAGRLEFLSPEVEQRFWRALADKRQQADVIHEEAEAIERMFARLRKVWLAESDDTEQSE